MASNHNDLARLASFFGGEEAINVVKALYAAGVTTDDVIANQANVRLNTARKILYQLDAFVRSRKKKALEKLRERLEYEKGHSFFMCPGCENVRMTFEEAMESAFRCTGCNGQMTNEDNGRIIQVLEDSARRLESDLSEPPMF